MSLKHKKFSEPLRDVLLMGAAFLLWAFIFREYLSSKLVLFEDALSYYDHIKFYLENLAKGVFPLWDPLWFCGAPNNFFLQRIGCFNPFLMVVLVFKAVGLPYTIAYLLYLMVYYFAGCVGFYLVARRVLNDRTCALVAFLLLLFSALGTRMFDSYMVLMFTPIVWFFYFLVSFSQEPRRHSFVGMTFALVTAFTTYLPFYFFLTVVSFLFFYILVYANTLNTLVPRYVHFLSRHKLIVAACVLVLLASLAPGYLFFKAGGKGEYVMPSRNYKHETGSVLGVQSQANTNSWAVLEEIFFAIDYYSDITLLPFAILYVPLFAYLIYFLGLMTPFNRKIIFFFLWIVGLLTLCIPIASPVYSFFYQHIFFFKYFRNLHFLLWVAILPIACLFLAEQLKSYLAWNPRDMREKLAGFFYVSLIHGGMAWYVGHAPNAAATSYFVIIFSYTFFIWRLFGSLRRAHLLSIFILFVIIAIEPVEIYSYLKQNAKAFYPDSYSYDFVDQKFHYTRSDGDLDMALESAPSVIIPENGRKPGERLMRQGALYYASKWYAYLDANIDQYVLKKYRKHRFILYDAVEHLNEAPVDFLALETALAENRNTAFLSTDNAAVLSVKPQGRVSYYARTLENDADDFKVVAFDANSIKIKTHFSKPQFLVYNDSFHKEWSALINGRAVSLVRANVAFKGLWIPEGEQEVEFKFGSALLWGIYLFLFAAVNAMFLGLVVLWWRESGGKNRAPVILTNES